MNIRIFLTIVIVVGSAIFISLETLISSSDIESRPNLVVIMTDDLDVNTLSNMLANELMPNLQKFLIKRGTEFTNSFVTNSECCPSRSTFLTGQYSHNHGVLLNPQVTNLDDNHTIATWLKLILF